MPARERRGAEPGRERPRGDARQRHHAGRGGSERQGLLVVETHAVLAKAFEATSQQISLEEFEKFVKTGSNFCYTGRVRRSCSIEHIDAVNRRKLL